MKIGDRSQGFTLIEVLVAVALSGIVLAAAYGVLISAQTGITEVGGRLEQELDTRKALDRLKRELEALYLEDDPSPGSTLTFLRFENREQFGEDRARLAFTAMDPGKGSVFQYEYRVAKGTLVKRAAGAAPAAEPVEIPYLDGIRSFRVEALSQDRWLPGWDTRVEFEVPDEIRISLTMEPGDTPIVTSARPRRNTRL